MEFIRKPILAVLAILIVLPLLPLIVWSVARGWFYPQVLPQQWSLTAWRFIFSDGSGVASSIATTGLIAVAVTVVAAIIGVPAGRALGLHEFRGKRAIELFMLAPIIVPGIAVVLGLHTVFIALGLTNTLTGVILAHLIPALPYMVLIMAAAFANFDIRFEEQARSLGASPLQVLLHITLPGIWPALLAASLLVFLVSWSQYILTLVIGGGRVATLPLLLYNFASAGRDDLTGALAVVYVLPVLAIVVVTSRTITGHNLARAIAKS